MNDLLFLAHRIPYPPNKGDKIRSWNILKHLSRRYRVHLGCFVDDAGDRQYEEAVRAVCAECLFVPIDPAFARIASIFGLLTGEPLTMSYFRSRRMMRWVTELAGRYQIKRVFVFSSSMAQYVIGNTFPGRRLVVDFVDVDSDKWAQYAERKPWPISWLYGRESRMLAALEREIAATADASLFVSEAEAQLFRSIAPESGKSVYAFNNGVEFDYFDPGLSFPDPFDGAEHTVVFTGQMDYWANVDAVVWFVNEVFPEVRRQVPDAGFWIVGANPSPVVTRLAGIEGVRVTGRVPDVRPYIAHARAVVAPLRIARGVQNKVLEAMSMAKHIVASPEAVSGIRVRGKNDVIVADGAKAFCLELVRLLGESSGQPVNYRARETIIEEYSWEHNLFGLNNILEGARL